MTRRFSQVDQILGGLDRALRISTGANGRPERSAALRGDSGDQAALRRAHASLVIASGIQTGLQIPGQSPSATRQALDQQKRHDNALRELTNVMQLTQTTPSVVSPLLFAAATATGLVTSFSGDSAVRALGADSRRRSVATLEQSAAHLRESTHDNAKGLSAARFALQKGLKKSAAHSAYEPRMSTLKKKVFDYLQRSVDQITSKV